MPALTLSLLGGFRARLDDRSLTLSKKAQALLAHLALSPGQTQPRTRLAGLLWGDRADEQARNSLRQTLFELRRVLGPAGEGCLIADHERVALNPINLSVDVLELEGAAGEDTLAAFERAAALYGGELLAGLMVKDPAFEGWLAGERERLHELGLRVLGALLTRQIATEACRSEPSRRPCDGRRRAAPEERAYLLQPPGRSAGRCARRRADRRARARG